MEAEPSPASSDTPSFSTPKLARKLPPPSMTCLEVSYRLGVPGCFISGVPKHGQGSPKYSPSQGPPTAFSVFTSKVCMFFMCSFRRSGDCPV